MLYISQLYFGGHFFFWRKPEYPEKTNHLPQVYRNQLHCAIRRHGNVVWFKNQLMQDAAFKKIFIYVFRFMYFFLWTYFAYTSYQTVRKCK